MTNSGTGSGSRLGAIAVVMLAVHVGVCRGQGRPKPINLEAASGTGKKVWAPRAAAADAPIEAARVRIVDFGNDFLRGGDGAPRHHFHCHRYALVQDKETGLWRPCDRPVAIDNTADVDGDGKLDDVVAFHEFSLDRPFNPVAPWYDTLAGTPRWYGGQAIYQANTRTSGFSEDGVNQDHDGQFAWPRENWAVFHETYETYGPYRLAANWLWLKHDFLNGGADGRVSLDEQSRLALLLKRYFMCVDSVRFLVRDGRQCYLSEATFRNAGAHALAPTKTRWAKYDPRAPHHIYFDPAQATFEPHEFTAVTGVGVYCSKDRFLPSYFGYKWYSFECDAVVHRPRRPGQNIDLVLFSPSGVAQPFYISRTEVPYELWKTILRQARSKNFVPPSQGFGFEKDGDMGSMDFGERAHSLQEPATDFTLHDAAAWCNALSELESRTPVYYEDAALQKPFREVRRSPAFRQSRPRPKLYVKWAADGYRLPTLSEWQLAWRGQKAALDDAVIGENSHGQTQPVATKKPNALGLYDMAGNVWELIWSFGDCYDPERAPAITVLGGDFLYPSDPAKRSASPYGDRPYEGSYSIGLRLLRREAGEDQFALADSAQPMHAADHAGLLVLQPRPQVEQLLQPPGEPLVVRRHRIRTLGGQPDPLGPLVQVAGQGRQHAPQVVPAQRGHPLLEERLDGVELPPPQLSHHRRRRLDKRLMRRRHGAQLGHAAGDVVFLQHPAADQARHLDDVDRRRPAGQDVLGDLRVDPRPPFAPAPLAGEILRRDERQEQPRVGQAVIQPVLPIVQAADLGLVEERYQRPPAGEPAVFGQQFLHEPTDPPAGIVRAGVGDEEVVQVGVARHGLPPTRAACRLPA